MYIKVRVYPKSKKEEFKKILDNKFEVKVKEKAERNLANKRVIELIAGHFEIENKKVKIVSGHQSPSKMLSVNLEE
ncbi:DUF167 domain-containing protein [Patescibacteria group bacterium]|nr:DUF167 domain-containing protein [Patescibacteria group bacterium]